ncbi:MAG: hypothetical protein ACHQKY_04955, partial [Terriglobia bacterium]
MKTRFLRLHRLQSLFFLCSVLSLLFLMPLRVTSAAVKNSECLTCHAMEGFQSPDSKNLFVNAKLFEKSVHS